MTKPAISPLLLIFFVVSFFSSTAGIQVTVENLKCEYLVNPIGLDTYHPRFSWQIQTSEANYSQQAYQLLIGTDSLKVSDGVGDIWNSEEVKQESIPAVYAGRKLNPFTRYYWSVRIKDQQGKWTSFSPVAFFETGMMEQQNWQGSWIMDSPDYTILPAPYFRKEFWVQKKVRSAKVYIAAAGLYELSLNGKKVGDHRLDPMYTRFDRRTLYVTYDLTSQLNSGENVVGVLLGNGWYNHQSTAVWYFDKAPWRARPKFCLDLRITYEDGSSEVIKTGQDWKTTLSPVVFNSIYTAEHYDARKELTGWDQPGYDDSAWNNAVATGAPSKNMVAQAMVPIRNGKEIPAQSMTKIDDHTYLFDFAQNMSGVVRIKARGEAGTVLRLKHAERLDKDGNIDQSNIDVHYRPTDDSDPFQTDIFILSGEKEDVFMPHFNYKGFQYVEVTSDHPVELSKESIVAYFMHSDVSPVGTIHSSNETLNKTWKAANNSYLSNLFGYPTDCPQREKNGWTGDAHINIETGLYNFDAITVYEKWMADHRDEQQANGVLPAIIPTDGWGYQWANGPDWTSTIAIIPWNVYLFYGDKKILDDCYDNIKRYVDYINANWPSGITDWGLGDWVPVKSKTPKEFTSTAYYYTDVCILSKAAKILGKSDDYEQYAALGAKIRKAFNEQYLDEESGIYGSGLQTEQSVALYWRLTPESLIPKVAARLAERVQEDNDHIDVGLLGTKTILNALSENGYADLAYRVASQETFPSWGWWIVNGATTFFENWPLDAKSDISMNHIMFGEIDAWYYKGLGGIFPDEKQPGFKNIILRPNFVEGLDHFKAKHQSPYGEIVSSWRRTGRTITYDVVVPPNSTATLQVKAHKIAPVIKKPSDNKKLEITQAGDNQYRILLNSGNYIFSIKEN